MFCACTRHIELDLASRAKDDQLVKLRESAKNKQRHLEGTCETLQTQLSEAEVTRRQLEWTITDLNKEKEVTVERLELSYRYFFNEHFEDFRRCEMFALLLNHCRYRYT